MTGAASAMNRKRSSLSRTASSARRLSEMSMTEPMNPSNSPAAVERGIAVSSTHRYSPSRRRSRYSVWKGLRAVWAAV